MDWSNGEWTEIAPRVWRAVCEPEGVNVALVAGDEGALIVDTGCCPEQGRALRAAAEALLDVPLTHALVTHQHYDHWYGLAAFADLHTIGHEGLAELAASETVRAEAAARGVDELVVPTELVGIVKVANLGNRFLEFVSPGRAHSSTDVFVTIGDARLVIAGDLLEQSGPPHLGPEADLENWTRAIDMLLGTMRRDGRILPGHGDVIDGDAAAWQRHVLNGILSQTKELINQGMGADQALDGARWPWEQRDVMQAAIEAGYRHWARKGLVPRQQLGLAQRHP